MQENNSKGCISMLFLNRQQFFNRDLPLTHLKHESVTSCAITRPRISSCLARFEFGSHLCLSLYKRRPRSTPGQPLQGLVVLYRRIRNTLGLLPFLNPCIQSLLPEKPRILNFEGFWIYNMHLRISMLEQENLIPSLTEGNLHYS